MTTDNAGNTSWVSDEQARTAARTPLFVEGWTDQEVKDTIANTPDFWQKYNGISNKPVGSEQYADVWYDELNPTGTSRWSPPNLSGDGGGIFGSSFLDPKQLSEYVEPINRYVGPLVLPTVMAIGGAAVGGPIGGMIGGSTGATIGAGIGASTYGAIDSVDKGDYLGALAKVGTSIAGAYAGGAGDLFSSETGAVPDYTSLAGNAFAAPTLTVDPSLAVGNGLITPDITTGFGSYMANPGADLGSFYNPPSFSVDPTLANNVPTPSLSPDVIAPPTYNNALTPTPEFQVNPALAPDAPPFTVNPELHAFSNTLPEYDPDYQQSTNTKPLSDAIMKLSKGLLGGSGANQKLPTFNVNFTPLSQQAFGTTGNNWMGTNKAAAGNAGTGFNATPFKGSFLANAGDDKRITDYLAEYLPINASKKLKDFSSFVA
jgi:hypothetical protein